MKKNKIKKIFVIISLFLFSMIFFVSCTKLEYAKIENQISEQTQILFAGEGLDFFVTLTGGLREEPYIKDGYSNPKVDFAVICLTLFNGANEDVIPITIKINGKEYSKILERNLIKSNYMTDLQIELKDNDDIYFYCDGQEVKLNNVSDTFETNYQEAIDIFFENFNDKLGELIVNGRFKGEVYLKILNNPIQNKGVYFWYVAVVGQNGNTYSAVIDTMSNQVLASF